MSDLDLEVIKGYLDKTGTSRIATDCRALVAEVERLREALAVVTTSTITPSVAEEIVNAALHPQEQSE